MPQTVDYLRPDDSERTPCLGVRGIAIIAILILVTLFNGFLIFIGLDRSPGSMAVLFIGPQGTGLLTLLLLALAPIVRWLANYESMVPYLLVAILAPIAGLFITIAALFLFLR